MCQEFVVAYIKFRQCYIGAEANGKFLDSNKSPSRKAGELDNRGSHFYLAMYWAEALAGQQDDAELRAQFEPIAAQLTAAEAKIIDELTTIQGKPVDIGGYYRPDSRLASEAMRASATLNQVLDSIGWRLVSFART